MEMKDDRSQEVSSNSIRRRPKARYAMAERNSNSSASGIPTSGTGIPTSAQNGAPPARKQKTPTADYILSFLQELEKERSGLLNEMSREDEDRQWYIIQLETLAQKLEALPYGDTDYPEEVDVSRRQLQHDAQRIRELMRKNLGTAEEIHARMESRSHRIRMIEAEMLRIRQQHHRQHQQSHNAEPDKRDSGTCDHLELERDGIILRDVATNTVTVGKEMRHEVETHRPPRHPRSPPGGQRPPNSPSTPSVTMATQTAETTDSSLLRDMLPLDGARVPPQTGDFSNLYHGSWPLQEGYDLMYNSGGATGSRTPHGPHMAPHDVTSVMSFGSSHYTGGSRQAAQLQHHNLGGKVEMVYSLLSMLGTHDKDDMSRTLLAMSSSPDSCIAMRRSGCLPLIIQLLHGSDKDSGLLGATRGSRHARARAAAALHNIVHSHPDDKRGRRESRVLRLLEQVRAHCDQLMEEADPSDVDDLDHHPGPAIAALMKLSFDEEHRYAICSLGGLQAIAELLRVDDEVNPATNEQYNLTMRRYACMALTNLTFGDGANKALLCSMKSCMKALVNQLNSDSEDLRQVAASVIRNLSWRADLASKKILREIGAVCRLMNASLVVRKESTLKSILSALWNLSAHCSENKADICAVTGALAFLVSTLVYKSPSKTLAIIENGGGILRNISSHIAVCEEYRAILREHSCLQILLKHLRSPSLTIVSNACGTLWNLSARCQEDQKTLWELGAVAMLRNLVHSKHKMISMGSTAALKNLLAARPYINCSDASIDGKHKSDMPTLAVRKQKALEAELDQSLSETCENVESPQPSPTETRRVPTNYIYPNDAAKTQTTEIPKDPKKIDLKTLDKCMEELKIKDTIPAPVERAPLMVNNYMAAAAAPKKEFVDDERPTDYSLRYAEQSDEEPYSDQPIDYSTRYQEPEVDEIRYVQARRTNDVIEEESHDVTQTFCTEGTPMMSKAASLTDLSLKVETIDETEEDQVQDFSSRYSEENDKNDDGTLTEAERFDIASEPSSDKARTYCEEGTPICFSHASSLSSLNQIVDDDKISPNKNINNKDTKPKKCSTKEGTKTPGSQKSVKFDASPPHHRANPQHHHHAQETPLMFSRCSSLESLDSFESHSVHSSVVSEYSRRASEVVSPSELPDSPGDSLPHSPKTRRRKDGENEELKRKLKTKESEELPTLFATEGTPHGFSTRTSLSSLSVEGSPKDVKTTQPTLKEPDTASVSASVSEISEDEDILKQCINSAMPAPNPTRKFRKSGSDFVIKKRDRRDILMSKSETEVRSEGLRVYATEGTPLEFSRSGSLSDLSCISGKSVPKAKAMSQSLAALPDDRSDSSAYSDEHDLLSEVIASAMPKKTVKKVNKPQETERSDQPLNFNTEDTPLNLSIGALSDIIQASPGSPKINPNITVLPENLDSTRAFAVEGTPVTFSCNDSLSSLSIDDDSDVHGSRRLPTYGESSPGSGKFHLFESVTRLSADGRSNSTPDQSLSPNRSSGSKRPPRKEASADQTMTFAVEDTPVCFSMNSSLSSMNSDEHEAPANYRDSRKSSRAASERGSRTPSERGGAVGFQVVENSPLEFSCNSSLSSLSMGSDSQTEQALLAECITSAMPKRRTDRNRTDQASKNGASAVAIEENNESIVIGARENESESVEDTSKRSSKTEELIAQYRTDKERRWSQDKEPWINFGNVGMSVSLNAQKSSTSVTKSVSRSDSYSSGTEELTVLDVTQAVAQLTVDDSNKESTRTISLSQEQSGSIEIDAAQFMRDDDRTEADVDLDDDVANLPLDEDDDVIRSQSSSTNATSPSTENGSVIERSQITSDDEHLLEENANLVVNALSGSIDDDSLIENETMSLVSNDQTEHSSTSDVSELSESVSTATIQAEPVLRRGARICKPTERMNEVEEPKAMIRGGKKTYGISPRKNLAPIKSLAKPDSIKMSKTAQQRMNLAKPVPKRVEPTQKKVEIMPKPENEQIKKVIRPKQKARSPPNLEKLKASPLKTPVPVVAKNEPVKFAPQVRNEAATKVVKPVTPKAVAQGNSKIGTPGTPKSVGPRKTGTRSPELKESAKKETKLPSPVDRNDDIVIKNRSFSAPTATKTDEANSNAGSKSPPRRGSLGTKGSRIATPVSRRGAPKKLDNEIEERPQAVTKQRTFTKDDIPSTDVPQITSPDTTIDQNGNCTDDSTLDFSPSQSANISTVGAEITDNFKTKFQLDPEVLEAVELTLQNALVTELVTKEEKEIASIEVTIPPRPKSTPLSEDNRNRIKSRTAKRNEIGVKNSHSAGQLRGRNSASPVRNQRLGLSSPQRKDSPRKDSLGRPGIVTNPNRRPSNGSIASTRSESPNQKKPGVVGKKQVNSKIAGLWKNTEDNPEKSETADEKPISTVLREEKVEKTPKKLERPITPRKNTGKTSPKLTKSEVADDSKELNDSKDRKPYERANSAPPKTVKVTLPRSSTYEKVSDCVKNESEGAESPVSDSCSKPMTETIELVQNKESLGSDSKLAKYMISNGKMLTSVAKNPVKMTQLQVSKIPGTGNYTRIAVETKRTTTSTDCGSADSLMTSEAGKDDSLERRSSESSQLDSISIARQSSRDDSLADESKSSDLLSPDTSECDSEPTKKKRGFSLFKRSNSNKSQKKDSKSSDLASPISPTSSKIPTSPTKSFKSELVKILSPKLGKKSRIPTSPKRQVPKSQSEIPSLSIDEDFSVAEYNRKCATLGSPRSPALAQAQAKASTLPAPGRTMTKTDMLLQRRQNMIQRRASVDSSSDQDTSRACLVTTV